MILHARFNVVSLLQFFFSCYGMRHRHTVTLVHKHMVCNICMVVISVSSWPFDNLLT